MDKRQALIYRGFLCFRFCGIIIIVKGGEREILDWQ